MHARAHTHAHTHTHMAVSVGVRQELLLDHAGERAAWRTETWCISQRTAAWINPFLRLDSTSEPVAYGADSSSSSWTHTEYAQLGGILKGLSRLVLDLWTT